MQICWRVFESVKLNLDKFHVYMCQSTYHVNGCIFELVLLFIVEDEAVLFDVADDRRLPPRTFQEGDEAVEDPILSTRQKKKC